MGEFDDLEARLRRFRPRRPAAIPDERARRLRGPVWLGVAAGMAAAVFVALWLHTPGSTAEQPTAATLGALNAVPAENLDATLTRISRATLPDVTRKGGALRELAKEF